MAYAPPAVVLEPSIRVWGPGYDVKQLTEQGQEKLRAIESMPAWQGLISGLVNTLVDFCVYQDDARDEMVNQAIEMFLEFAPEDMAQAMIAKDIVVSMKMADHLLERARNVNISQDERDELTAQAFRWKKLNIQQLQGWTKLRNSGKQQVTVKHVHVNDGGQAIVGAVNSKKSIE